MKITQSLAGLTAAALLATGGAQAQQIEMTLAHVLSDQSPYQVTLNEFKRLIEERTDGRITVDIQCCGQAGNETQAIQSWRTGILSGGFVGGSTLETIMPAFRVLSLPYLFENKQQAYEILQGDIGREMLDLLESVDLHGLGFGSIYERSVASLTPVESVDDLAGMKLRVLPTPGFVEAYNALGTQPTPMAFGEVFMAVQNRVVDGLEISPDSFVADRFHEVAPYFTLTRTHQSTTVFVMGKPFWNSLSAEDQALIQETALEAIAVGIAAHDELAAAGLVTAAEAGVTIIEPDLAPFMEKARTSWDVILADAPEAAAYLERFQAAMGN